MLGESRDMTLVQSVYNEDNSQRYVISLFLNNMYEPLVTKLSSCVSANNTYGTEAQV